MKPTAGYGQRVLPLAYWLERFPPGWLSRYSATSAEPLVIAREIQAKLVAFDAWLSGPDELRCDTYLLQSLSAALFNRYLDDANSCLQLVARRKAASHQLSWPQGSENIQECLRDLRNWLEGPFAVYKALRSSTSTVDTPNSEELQLAEATLLARREELRTAALRLGFELDCYRLANVLATRPQAKSNRSVDTETATTQQSTLAK